MTDMTKQGALERARLIWGRKAYVETQPEYLRKEHHHIVKDENGKPILTGRTLHRVGYNGNIVPGFSCFMVEGEGTSWQEAFGKAEEARQRLEKYRKEQRARRLAKKASQ